MMKHLTISLLAIILWLSSAAQIGCVSQDSKFLATLVYEQGQNQLLIHELPSGKLVKKIPVAFNSIKQISFSYKNKFIIALSSNILYIYNINNKQLVRKFYQVKDYSISKSILAVISNSYPYTIDLNNLLQRKYNIASGKIADKISISQNGKYLFVITKDNWIYIFKYSYPSMIEILRGNNIYPTDDSFLTETKTKNNIILKKYSFTSDNKPQIVYSYDISQILKKIGESSEALSITHTIISPQKDKIAIFLNYGNNKKIIFYNLNTPKKISQIDNSQYPGSSFYPIAWTNNNTIIIASSGVNGIEYDMNTGITTSLYWEMLNPDRSPALTYSEQLNKRIFSPNYHYVIMNIYEGPRIFLLVRDALIKGRQISYADAHFISFSPDSKKIFLLIKGIVFQLNTKDIRYAMQKNTVAQLMQLGTAIYGQISEQYKAKDDTPPKGYKYIFTPSTKKVNTVDSEKLFVLLRGINLDPKNVELKLNLVDEKGNIITGATNPQWLYIWCNLLLQNKSLQVDQSNFIVKEVHENQPTAYALVLDHSGSMGDIRANALQFGALQLIKKKKPQDAFMLIKYDNHVKIEVNLTKNISSFYKPLGNTGLNGFGGGTALNDAAYIAISQLTKAQYPRKVIFLFTDGYENASQHTKEQIIQAAQKNNIEIFTIGFGNDINKQYLQDIAYLTGGAFYHIYKTQDLKKIFLDVDLKRRYYYKIDFNTQYPGKYIALLQLCQNFQHHDSIILSFDNNPHTPKYKRQIKINPNLSPAQKKAFEKKIIPCRAPDKPVKDPTTVKEFYNIDFPNILFEFDSDKIIKAEEKGLIQIAEFMKRHPDVYLLIEGHTDNIGTHQYNMDLSKRRAEAAKRLLIAKGIAPGRIFTRGYGETRPIASNETEEGRSKNRRIEFHIFKY